MVEATTQANPMDNYFGQDSGGYSREFSPDELVKMSFFSIARAVFVSEDSIILGIKFCEAAMVEQIKRDVQYQTNVKTAEDKLRTDFADKSFASTAEFESFIQTQLAWKKLSELCSLLRRVHGEDIVYRLSADTTVYGRTKALKKYIEMRNEKKKEKEARENELLVPVPGEVGKASGDAERDSGGDSGRVRPNQQGSTEFNETQACQENQPIGDADVDSDLGNAERPGSEGEGN